MAEKFLKEDGKWTDPGVQLVHQKTPISTPGWYRFATMGSAVNNTDCLSCCFNIYRVWSYTQPECHRFYLIKTYKSCYLKPVYDLADIKTIDKIRVVYSNKDGVYQVCLDLHFTGTKNEYFDIFVDSDKRCGNSIETWNIPTTLQSVPETVTGETVLATLDLKTDYWVGEKGKTSLTTISKTYTIPKDTKITNLIRQGNSRFMYSPYLFVGEYTIDLGEEIDGIVNIDAIGTVGLVYVHKEKSTHDYEACSTDLVPIKATKSSNGNFVTVTLISSFNKGVTEADFGIEKVYFLNALNISLNFTVLT